MQLIYPNSHDEAFQEFAQDFQELASKLSEKGFELVKVKLQLAKDSSYAIHYYTIRVPEICFSRAELVINEISYFWDFNRMDDEILKTALNYRNNIFSIAWKVYC